jgi:hypothetical protein
MEQLILHEDQAPAQSNRAVVIIGRFQPPTIGHYKIVNLAKKFIRENTELELFTKPIIVIVDGKKSGKNKKENPLTVDERIYYMKNSGRANGVVFLSAANAFAAFNEVRKAGYEPIVVGAGSDRIKGYISLLDDKFLDAKEKKQKHYELPGLETRHELKGTEENLSKIDSAVPISKVSGSLARRAAELDYFEEFVTITGLDRNIPAAKKLFKQIKKQIGEEQ